MPVLCISSDFQCYNVTVQGRKCTVPIKCNDAFWHERWVFTRGQNHPSSVLAQMTVEWKVLIGSFDYPTLLTLRQRCSVCLCVDTPWSGEVVACTRVHTYTAYTHAPSGPTCHGTRWLLSRATRNRVLSALGSHVRQSLKSWPPTGVGLALTVSCHLFPQCATLHVGSFSCYAQEISPEKVPITAGNIFSFQCW